MPTFHSKKYKRKTMKLCMSALLIVVSTITIQAAANVIIINSQNQFNTLIIESKKPAVVKFGATWCPACNNAENPFAQLAQEFPNVTFATVDVDKNVGLTQKYNVSSLPTFLFFNNGSVVNTQVGFSNKDVKRVLTDMKPVMSSQASDQKKTTLATKQEPTVIAQTPAAGAQKSLPDEQPELATITDEEDTLEIVEPIEPSTTPRVKASTLSEEQPIAPSAPLEKQVTGNTCIAQTQSFFERAYYATRDFLTSIGTTVRSWFR